MGTHSHIRYVNVLIDFSVALVRPQKLKLKISDVEQRCKKQYHLRIRNLTPYR